MKKTINREIKYTIKVFYQPINKMWGVCIKNGNIIANEVDENLITALKEVGKNILIIEKLLNSNPK